MPARIPLDAPWWTALRQEETNIFLEREIQEGAATAYGVYRDTERIGHVFSTKDDKHVDWFAAPGDQTHEGAFPDRFNAVRFVAGHNA